LPAETICLITPPSVFLLDERVFCSLGILRVAACLERDGYTVEHLDLSGVEDYERAVRDHVQRTSAVFFGLTATTPQMPAVVNIVRELREVVPRTKLILGGPHVTLVNAARKREVKTGEAGRATRAFQSLVDAFDVLVAGDGDDAVFHAIMPDAPKLIDADDAASALFLTNDRYNELPYPARHLVDMNSYHYTIDGVAATSMIAQLGCSYGCNFCGGRNSAMLRRIRTRTTESIVAEVAHLHREYGVNGVMFYDDELNINKSMIELMDAIADLQAGLGVEFRLRGFVKSNLFTDAQAAAMYRAGFRWILVGFESGSPRILENIQKKATREQNSECMAIARRHGLKVKALMSIGHAGESAETIEATKDWLLQEKPDDFDCTVISCYAGTNYYDLAVETAPGIWTYAAKNGDRLHSYEIDFNIVVDAYKGMPGDYRSYVFTDDLSAEDIVKLRDDLERDVRAELGIPYPSGVAVINFEHSMGQSGPLPPNILRVSEREAVTA
jgi:anaerobic magnesium-protoporphyrin IX monomethyl ester cyclase